MDLSIHPFEEYSSLMKNLLVRLLKKDRKERLTCTDAAKHVWFTPSAEETSLSQSDVGNFAFLRSNTNETPAQIANVRRLEKMR